MFFKAQKYIYAKAQNLGKRFGFDLAYYMVNGFWVTLSQVVGITASVAVTVAFARFATKELYGQYSFLMSVFTTVSIITIPGLNTSVLRSIAQGFDGVYKKSVRYRFIWSLLGTPILLAIGWYYFYKSPNLGLAIMLSSLVFPFYFTLNLWAILLQGKKDFKRVSIFVILKTVVSSVAVIISIFYKASFPVIFFSFIGGFTLTNILVYFLTIKQLTNEKEEFSWKKSGLKLSSISLTSLIFDYLDKILIGIFLPIEYLAVYSIATGITGSIRNLFKSLVSTIYPKVFEMDVKQLFGIMQKMLLKTVLGVSIAVGVIILVIPYLIRFLYSDKYDDAIVYAQVYLVIIPFATVVNILYSYFIAIKKENFLLSVYNIGVVLNIILFLIAIPIWELWGAIFSSLIYQIILSSLYVFYWVKYRHPTLPKGEELFL